MTHHKPPPSFEAALDRISGQLGGKPGMCAVVNRSSSQIYAWGNPEMDDGCPITLALKLDLAFIEQGGIGAPLYEAYTAQLDAAFSHRFADALALGRLAPEVMRESSQAEIALVEAMQPDATPRDLQETLREVDEAVMSWQRARTLLKTMVGRAMGRQPGHTPELDQAGPSQAPP